MISTASVYGIAFLINLPSFPYILRSKKLTQSNTTQTKLLKHMEVMLPGAMSHINYLVDNHTLSLTPPWSAHTAQTLPPTLLSQRVLLDYGS